MAMDLNDNSYYQSIRFTPDGFCLYLNSDNNTELCKLAIKADLSKDAVMDTQSAFQKAIHEIGFDTEKETKIIHKSDFFCCAPRGVFDKEDCINLLHFQNNNFNANEQITLVEHLNQEKMDLFFSVDRDTYNFFNSTGIKHIDSCQISELIADAIKHTEAVVVCNITHTGCEVAAAQNKELILANNYCAGNTEDIVYTILNIAQTVFDTNMSEVKFLVYNANLEIKNFCLDKISNIQFK